MNNVFQQLEGNDDVLSLDNATLKVGQFKEDLEEKFWRIVTEELNYGRKNLAIDKYSIPKTIWGTYNQISWMGSPRDGIDCELLTLGANNWQKGKLRILIIVDFFPALEQFQHSPALDLSSEIRRKGLQWSDIFEVKVVLEFIPEQSEVLELIPEQQEVSKPSTSNQIKDTELESLLDDIRRTISQEN